MNAKTEVRFRCDRCHNFIELNDGVVLRHNADESKTPCAPCASGMTPAFSRVDIALISTVQTTGYTQ